MDSPGVELVDVHFAYAGVPAVRGVNLGVPRGAFVAVLGPSGCGKSTLLKLVGGYLTPTSGTIRVLGRDVTRLPPNARRAGTVFQNYALFPHLTARRNVSFGPEVRGEPADVSALLGRVGLPPAEADRFPHELSGGQQQRVAVARALAIRPDVLLLDEPLANLDRRLRDRLRGELRDLSRSAGVTTLFVTHDQEEALAAADLVAVMHAGKLIQIGPPMDVYHHPRTPFAAAFLGDANVFDGIFIGQSPGPVLVRPERIHFAPGEISLAAAVRSVAFLGPVFVVETITDAGLPLRVRSATPPPGDRVTLGFAAAAVWRIPDADA